MNVQTADVGTDPLSASPISKRDERFALTVVIAALAVFATLAPFAKIPLAPSPVFIPLYQAALIINDVITAALLFAQWRVARARPLYILALGYLFTALMTVLHTMTFPGLFSPEGLLGAGPQSTAWLYMFWHALFPIYVGCYALAQAAPTNRNTATIGILATVCLVAALGLLATRGEWLLPPIMTGHGYLPIYHFIGGVVWLCSFGALVCVYRRRPRTVLDLWVMVVMCVWICEVALGALLNAGRFDLGFYAGRIYGFAGASFLLGVLIFQWSDLYTRVAAASMERAGRAQAEATNRAKDQFMAMLGHELRNPLAPIVTALQLMRMRDSSALAQERLIIERQVNHLRRMVDDLLDVSRFTRGKIELRRSHCEAADIIARALEIADPLIQTGRHRLSVNVQPIGLALDCDCDRVTQALGNLVCNAAKFTPPEGRIEVFGERQGEQIVFRVRDNGVGLSPELLDFLFEPFAQAPQSLARSQGGLGLGLAIVKSIAGLHGGGVEAYSDGAGTGTELILRLPAALVSDSSSSRTADYSHARNFPLTELRMLIVDDNVDAANTIAQALRMSGIDCKTAHEGAEALKVASDFRPQVALVDLGLPDMTGIELASRLRRLSGQGQLHVVALSGYGHASARDETSAAGFDAHFVKPVEVDALTDLLMRCGLNTHPATQH